MIDKSKQYSTRDGREVRIYATDGGDAVVHGAYNTESFGWWLFKWDANGQAYSKQEHDLDLIEVRPRIKFDLKVKLYPDGSWMSWRDGCRHAPSEHGGKILTFPIDIEVPE